MFFSLLMPEELAQAERAEALEFDIEAGRIKSISEPRLADRVRREALKFLNELKRAV